MTSPMSEPAACSEPSPRDPRPSGIGARLRAQREKRDIGLREIARRVGVSPSLVSQIERDRISPSVATLWALVTELGMTMSDVFGDGGTPGAPSAARTARARDPVSTPETRFVLNLESGVRWERLTTTSDPNVEFIYVLYPVGAASCEEDSLIKHGGHEYGYVISGRLGVRVGFDEYELGPGDAISFDSALPHRLSTIGDQPATAIWAVVGRAADARRPTLRDSSRTRSEPSANPRRRSSRSAHPESIGPRARP